MRKISLVTASRAEYGIQRRLIGLLDSDPEVEFSLIVSGTHLSKKHGYTVREIVNDGFPIARRVDIGIDSDLPISEIMARALTGFTRSMEDLRPDLVIMLGDRYEMLAAGLACTLLNIPIAHLHGGETTIGATDEVFRHSLTKTAYLHFTSCEEYRRRVIQLGEDPIRVFNVGSLGVENIHNYNLISRDTLERELDIKFRRRNLLVTFHPVTFQRGCGAEQVHELLMALDARDDTSLFFTRPNADAEGDQIAKMIFDFASTRGYVTVFPSLGSLRYLSLAKYVDAVVGNSSSGIIEVPSLGTATVNVGDRQKGRICAASVICCRNVCQEISSAIDKAVSDDFQASLMNVENPYDKADTASEILRVVKTAALSCHKVFYDLR